MITRRLNSYATVAESTNAGDISTPEVWRAEELESWLLDLAIGVNDGKEVVPSMSLFEQGFDR